MKNISEKGRSQLESGCYFYERGELQEAFLAFQIAAKLGSPEAQVNLANMLSDGEACEKNFKKASYWYKRAVKKSVPEAAYNLAISYKQQGKTKWAKFWFERAAEMGYEE